MKSKILLFAISIFFVFASHAQNVGIGTTTPGTKLTVAGGIASTPVSAAAAASVTIPSNASIFYLTAVSGSRTDALTMTSPTAGQYLTIYNLDGNPATFAGYTITASTGVMTFQYINGTWQAVSDNSFIGGSNYVKNQTAQQASSNFNISGNGVIGGTEIVSGLVTQNGGLTETGAANINNNANNATNINTGTSTGAVNVANGSAAGTVSIGKSNTMTLSGGNVGIGIPAPTNPLQVQVGSSGSSIDQQSTNITTGTTGTTQWQSFTAGISGTLSSVEIYYNGVVSTPNTLTCSVYAGTGTGGTLLSSNVVNHPSGQTTGMGALNFGNPTIVAGTTYTLCITSTSELYIIGSSGYAGSYYSSDYGLNPGWNLWFQNTVTTVPAQFLVTSGTGVVRATTLAGTGSRIVTADASGNLTATTTTASLVNNIYANDGTLAGGRTVTMSGYKLNFTGGNVGIGTASPAYPLDVTGNGRFNTGGATYVYVGSGSGAYYGDGTNLVTQMPVGGSFYMANVGTDGTRVSQSNGTMRVGGPNQTSANLYVYGQEGVGTLSPYTNLDVLGSIVNSLHSNTSEHATSEQGSSYIGHQAGSGWGSDGFNGLHLIVAPGTNGCGNTGDVAIMTWECNTASQRDVMRVTGRGNVGIGTSTPSCPIDAEGNTNNSGTLTTPAGYIGYFKNSGTATSGAILTNVGSNANGCRYMECEVNGSEVGCLYGNGGNALNIYSASDQRLKKNIRNTNLGLHEIMQIPVRDYTWRDGEKNVSAGFIAQELYKVYPDAVLRGDDEAGLDTKKGGTWMVNYAGLTPLIVKSIQDQQHIIEDQKAEIEQLKKQISELKSASATLEEINKLKASVETLQQILQSKAEK